MGLNWRKSVIGGFRTTKAQTSLCIHPVLSAPLLFAFWKVLKLARSEFALLELVSVAEQAGLGLTGRKLRRQFFSRRGPYKTFKVMLKCLDKAQLSRSCNLLSMAMIFFPNTSSTTSLLQ